MKKNLPVTDHEIYFADELISTTNLKGVISGFNDAFEKTSGFPKEELMNVNHNIIRHPDMPPAAFTSLWKTIKANKHWMGMVKNRTKQGDFYWVDAYVTPIFDGGNVVGYESVRSKPTADKVQRAKEHYKAINEGKSAVIYRPIIKQKACIAAMSAVAITTIINQLDIFNFIGGSWVQAGVSILAGAAVYFGMKSWVFSRLDEAVEQARKDNDDPLTTAIYTGAADEIGQLTLANQLIQAKLNTILCRIDGAVKNIDEKAVNTANSQTAIMASISSQASQIEQVVTAVTEMSASIQEVAKSAGMAAETAIEADKSTNISSGLASTAVASLSDLDLALENVATIIQDLEQSANAINPIVDVISDITEKTNLLALNAAIEAARAGEHGRGFAVVADEVRTLAGRTQQSTTEISSLIDKLNQSMTKAVSAMSKTKETAASSRGDVEKSIASVSDIASKIKELTDLNTMIATAAEEQSSVTEDINRNIVRISTDAEDIVANADIVSGNIEGLAQEASDLANMLTRFKT